jgi:hypothetical protein
MSSLKIFSCKGTLGQVFIGVHFCRRFSHVVIFHPIFVICTLFSLVQLFPLPPLPRVNKCTVYMQQCVRRGEVRGSGPQTDKHLPQSPFTGRRHFVLPYMSLIFLLFSMTQSILILRITSEMPDITITLIPPALQTKKPTYFKHLKLFYIWSMQKHDGIISQA